MKKFLAVAALCAASFAVPVLPSQAAPLSAAESNCLVFPMLKKECWELGAEKARAATATTTAAAADAGAKVKLPLWWNCSRAPAGSGHLLDC